MSVTGVVDAPVEAAPPRRGRAGAIVGAALALRLFFILFLIRYLPGEGDSPYYTTVATNILRHGTHSEATAPPFLPSMFRAPGYPAFIALERLLFGESIVVLQLLQAVIGTATVFVLHRAATKLDAKVGLAVGWSLALCPFDAAYNGAVLSETLVTFFLALALSAPLLWPGARGFVIAGFAFGLGALTRDVYMLMMFGIAGFAGLTGVFARGSVRKRTIGPALMLLAGVLTIAPWTARNYAVSGHVIPISRGVFARALWFGTWVVNGDHHNDDQSGRGLGVRDSAFHLPGEKELFWKWVESEDAPERDRVFMRMFKERVAAEPGTVALVYVRRAPQVWVGTSRFESFSFRPALLARNTTPWWLVKSGLFALNFTVVTLGFLSALQCVRRRRWPWVWYALPLFYTIAVFLPIDTVEPRYTEPVFPFLIVLAALLVVERVPAVKAFARRIRSASSAPSSSR